MSRCHGRRAMPACFENMNSETYKTLTEKEKMLHDEMFAFCKRLTDEMFAIRQMLEKAFKEPDAS